jgi:Skp family chaperone for outer membrane proteins
MTIKQLFPILFLAFSFSAIQAQKVGHLNSQTLLAEMPEVKEAESNLKAFQTQLGKFPERNNKVRFLQNNWKRKAKS